MNVDRATPPPRALLVVGLAVAACWPGTGGIGTAEADTLEHRLTRIERLIDSGVLRDLLERMEANERELRDLRDQVERLGHELERERLRQRDLYRDLDRRVQALEGTAPRGASPQAAPPSAAPAPAGEPPAPPAQTTAMQPSDGSTPAVQAAEEVQAYRQARNLLLEERRPEAAIAAFQRFLEDHPQSRYRPNALYWMAEAYYGKRDYQRALRGFQHLIDRFPDSDKAPDARLKLGYTLISLGRLEEARTVLQEIVDRYPGTSVARLAAQKLRQLR